MFFLLKQVFFRLRSLISSGSSMDLFLFDSFLSVFIISSWGSKFALNYILPSLFLTIFKSPAVKLAVCLSKQFKFFPIYSISRLYLSTRILCIFSLNNSFNLVLSCCWNASFLFLSFSKYSSQNFLLLTFYIIYSIFLCSNASLLTSCSIFSILMLIFFAW